MSFLQYWKTGLLVFLSLALHAHNALALCAMEHGMLGQEPDERDDLWAGDQPTNGSTTMITSPLLEVNLQGRA